MMAPAKPNSAEHPLPAAGPQQVPYSPRNFQDLILFLQLRLFRGALLQDCLDHCGRVIGEFHPRASGDCPARPDSPGYHHAGRGRRIRIDEI